MAFACSPGIRGCVRLKSSNELRRALNERSCSISGDTPVPVTWVILPVDPHVDILLFFAYSETVVTTRKCRVAFTDSEGMRHSVEVVASTLYEAAALAVAEFRRCGFADAAPGSAARLTVSVEAPSTAHELSVRKLSAWLEGGGKSPREQALKVRLRELLGGS